MAYCSQDDLARRYGELELIQLTDREGLGYLQTEVLAGAIGDADAEIDAYLRDGGYELPLADPPHVLVRHACQIARYYLYDDARPEAVALDYRESLDWLERVATGRVKLDMAGANPRTPGGISAGTRSLIYDDTLLAQYTL